MTPAESNKALVRRFYEEIDKGTSMYSMKWSRRITWITIPRLCPAWRPGARA